MSRRRPSRGSRVPAGQRVQVFRTQLGWVAMLWHGARLRALAFGLDSAQAALAALDLQADAPVAAHTKTDDPVAQRIRAYLAGQPDDFQDVAVDLDGYTEFQQRVLQNCRRIRYGQTLTYSQLARRVGSPAAARAVGSTMARNRLPLVIPCHRVVGSGGLCGFSAPGGVAVKQRLLQMEAARKEPA
jgi:methylated-DNA-[protein]-cysteine S-methyltransferase